MPTSRRLPKHRAPTTPGEMLAEEFIKPLGLSQSELARRMKVPVGRISQILNNKRALTADTALRLELVLGMSASFWLGLQQDFDLWQARRRAPKGIKRLRIGALETA